MAQDSRTLEARGPLAVGDEINAIIDLTSAQIFLIRLAEDEFRVGALDVFARPLRTTLNFTDEATARLHARLLTQELRLVRCRQSPITTRIVRAAR